MKLVNKTVVISTVLAILFSLGGTSVHAKAGAKCAKAGQTRTIKGVSYICTAKASAKKGAKATAVWVASTSTTSTTPATSTTSTTSTTTTIKVTCAQGGVCAVGDTGPGGGIVFYVAPAPFTQIGATGSMCTTSCKYLEAAPRTWNNAAGDPLIAWVSDYTTDYVNNWWRAVSGADGVVVGTGYQNSLDIVAQAGNIAASSAAVASRAYAGGGKTDWFLGSRDEMNELCKYARKTGQASGSATVCAGGESPSARGFSLDYYWSSTEVAASSAWFQDLILASASASASKNFATSVRPVRAFG